MPEPLRMISVNCEGDKHWSRLFPFFSRFQPDVICFQEIFEDDFAMIKEKLGMDGVFAPLAVVTAANQYEIALRGRWGIAVLTKLPYEDANYAYYKGSGDRIPEFVDGNPNAVNRALATVHCEKDGLLYVVATTHFTWSTNGETTDEQRRDFAKLEELLVKTPEVILCGDFNAPRGREIFSKLSRTYIDNVPADITSTLDPDLHRTFGKPLVVDGLFSSPVYQAEEVKVVCGVSDHCAIEAVIKKIEEK